MKPDMQSTIVLLMAQYLVMAQHLVAVVVITCWSMDQLFTLTQDIPLL